MNGSVDRDTALFWDEPKANLNPKLIPVLVEVLMELSRYGVQIFLATHDYNLMKYFSIAKKEHDQIAFHSLYKATDGVKCESSEDFASLEKTP